MKYKERVEASKEYGLFKFKVPSIEERNAAIDMSGEGTLYKKIILTDLNSFYFINPFKSLKITIKLVITGFYLIKNTDKPIQNLLELNLIFL